MVILSVYLPHATFGSKIRFWSPTTFTELYYTNVHVELLNYMYRAQNTDFILAGHLHLDSFFLMFSYQHYLALRRIRASNRNVGKISFL